MHEPLLKEIAEHPDYQLLRRVPTNLSSRENTDTRQFSATIIDLETMGLDAKTHEIIEIGILSFSFSTKDGILGILTTYNELNDPGKPIPAEVTKVTKIRDEDVKGRAIDWDYVLSILQKSHLVICHNSGFDRKFLELQTPDAISKRIQSMPFACTIKDINWQDRGFESSKLDYLNWKLGYFYDGHRAINDCWATLNLLLRETGAFDELKDNVRKKETLLCATNAPFDKKDLLKERQYRWADGLSQLPKCWWTTLSNEKLDAEKTWLDEMIYGKQGASEKIPQHEITAKSRYSLRAEEIKNNDG